MSVEFLTINTQNFHWAVNENFRRAFAELNHKIPVDGTATLMGDLDFGGTGTVLNVEPSGPQSAIPNSYAGE